MKYRSAATIGLTVRNWVRRMKLFQLFFGKKSVKAKASVKVVASTKPAAKAVNDKAGEKTLPFEYAASLLDKDATGHFIEPEDSFDLEIVGEASYQAELEQIAGPKTHGGANLSCDAILVCETNNKYDKNAVGVHIAGRLVGYLSKVDAKNWRKMLKREVAVDANVRVRAKIVGGWVSEKKGQISEGSYGVKLDVPVDSD